MTFRSYPTLANPKLIYADPSISKVNNHSYRTMTQYVGSDGHVYQATATSGSQILRINGTTNEYDNYNFDLKTALGTNNAVAIRAWRYIKDGIVLYTETNVAGGFIAPLMVLTVTFTGRPNKLQKERS